MRGRDKLKVAAAIQEPTRTVLVKPMHARRGSHSPYSCQHLEPSACQSSEYCFRGPVTFTQKHKHPSIQSQQGWRADNGAHDFPIGVGMKCWQKHAWVGGGGAAISASSAPEAFRPLRRVEGVWRDWMDITFVRMRLDPHCSGLSLVPCLRQCAWE